MGAFNGHTVIAAALAVISMAGCGMDPSGGNSKDPAPRQANATRQPTDLIATYCVSCHKAARPADGVALDTLEARRANAAKAQEEIEGGDMLPSNASQPTAEERQAMLAAFGNL